MASSEHKISKLGAAVITREITLTFPGAHEIFRSLEVLQATVSIWQHKALDC